MSIDSGSDAEGCPTSFGYADNDNASASPVNLRTATNTVIKDLG